MADSADEKKPVDKADAQAALGPARTSGAKRKGKLAVSSAKITGGELKNIELALQHPPTKVNWATAITSFLAAAYVAGKTWKDAAGKLEGSAAMVFVLSILVVGGVVATTWRHGRQKHPHHERALDDVRKLMQLHTDL